MTMTALQRLMTNLAGHDMESVLDAFHGITDDRPTCFIAYTIKGYGLPFAGHKDNHAGLMNREQMAVFQRSMAVPERAPNGICSPGSTCRRSGWPRSSTRVPLAGSAPALA